jgi:hypothetical protein
LSTSEKETRIGTKEGTNVEDGSQAEEGTITELGLKANIFSSNLTYLLIIISLHGKTPMGKHPQPQPTWPLETFY